MGMTKERRNSDLPNPLRLGGRKAAADGLLQSLGKTGGLKLEDGKESQNILSDSLASRFPGRDCLRIC